MENSDIAFIIMSFVAVLAGVAVFYLKDRNKSLTIELRLRNIELTQKDMKYDAALMGNWPHFKS
jgi:5-bromo-4-chloroindolyl phosphate hydrolysis protein